MRRSPRRARLYVLIEILLTLCGMDEGRIIFMYSLALEHLCLHVQIAKTMVEPENAKLKQERLQRVWIRYFGVRSSFYAFQGLPYTLLKMHQEVEFCPKKKKENHNYDRISYNANFLPSMSKSRSARESNFTKLLQFWHKNTYSRKLNWLFLEGVLSKQKLEKRTGKVCKG